MRKLVSQTTLSKGDLEWWPKWVERYARWTQQESADRIRITEDQLIAFLRQLRDSGKSAWTRLQVVRALEFYVRTVLREPGPDLTRVRQTLEAIAERENVEPHAGGRDSHESGTGQADDSSSTAASRSASSPAAASSRAADSAGPAVTGEMIVAERREAVVSLITPQR